MTAGWTEDRVGALKKLWMEGQSAAHIARELRGGVTRSAVIGKVHRLGLSQAGRANPELASKPARPPATRPVSIGIAGNGMVFDRGEARPPRVAVEYPEEPAGSVTILTAKAHHCRWPTGEGAALTFCGKTRRDESVSYCLDHSRVAFQGKITANGRRIPTTIELERSLRRFT